MKYHNSYHFSLKLELTRLGISALIFRADDGGRLPDLEHYQVEPTSSWEPAYVGSRTRTRLPSLSKQLVNRRKSDTQFSDFLHAIVPIIYLSSSPKGGWTRATWTSWFLSTALEYASILALPESKGPEKKMRMKKLFIDAILKQPMFDRTLNKPATAISNVWNKIPLLRDLNYLEYYLHMHKKYFYFNS
jgi:hypothetical protein